MNLITENAGMDSLSEEDYMDMLAELLETYTLRKLVDVLHSMYSHTYWSNFSKGERPLTREAKSELRVAMKLPPLPLTVEKAVAVASVNAKVYQKGVETPDTIIMTNHTETPYYTHGEAPVRSVAYSNARRNERIFDMPMALLGWKIANREVMA